jgi:hypothetical protein
MQPTDIALEVLKEIRDGVRATNTRIEGANDRLDRVSARLDLANDRIDGLRETIARRIVESEIRSATALAELVGSVSDLAVVLRAQHDLRPRVEQCERDIEELRRRLP